MRRLLTGGIKATLAIAALATAAQWAARAEREPGARAPAMAAIPDPVVTGSITPRRVERAEFGAAASERGLDQDHLAQLIAGTAPEAPRAQRTTAKR